VLQSVNIVRSSSLWLFADGFTLSILGTSLNRITFGLSLLDSQVKIFCALVLVSKFCDSLCEGQLTLKKKKVRLISSGDVL